MKATRSCFIFLALLLGLLTLFQGTVHSGDRHGNPSPSTFKGNEAVADEKDTDFIPVGIAPEISETSVQGIDINNWGNKSEIYTPSSSAISSGEERGKSENAPATHTVPAILFAGDNCSSRGGAEGGELALNMSTVLCGAQPLIQMMNLYEMCRLGQSTLWRRAKTHKGCGKSTPHSSVRLAAGAKLRIYEGLALSALLKSHCNIKQEWSHVHEVKNPSGREQCFQLPRSKEDFHVVALARPPMEFWATPRNPHVEARLRGKVAGGTGVELRRLLAASRSTAQRPRRASLDRAAAAHRRSLWAADKAEVTAGGWQQRSLWAAKAEVTAGG
ncbi:hypothetical protein CYMTET_27085 [Cymbomonas tetramitiformis]|uniref:Uncharacterized protein n=1 Tax=Cymbomonas tetramitiformis TaxID=36881 RepID=A0AAE0KX83_9CHLO|nr:hypothetical protein CYMTET_27085 [Cymbomonas tetramitiformis]